MSEIDKYTSAVAMMSRAAFIQANPNPFLLVKLEDAPVAAAKPADDDWSGTTRMTRIVGKTGSFAVLRHNAATYRVHKMVPADPATIRSHPTSDATEIKMSVTLGRTPENDVVIAETAVSKTHARFSCDFRGEWKVMDLGSRNGTTVNGRRLAADQSAPINFGDPIILGGLAVMLIGAGALYEIVSAQSQATRL